MPRTFIKHFPERFPRAHRWGGRLLTLFVGQSILQAVGFVTGFLLIRWMSVEAYAQFGVVFGFQSTLGILVDLGFSGCIVSLVGNRGGQPEIIGAYIAAAHWFRNRVFAIVIPLSAIAFYWIGLKHRWNGIDLTLLFLCIVVALYSQGRVSWYSAPLLIHHRIVRLYRVQNMGAVGRLVASVLLHAGGWLSALTATIVNTASLVWMAVSYAREARSYVRIPQDTERQIRREMLAYIAPQIPGIAFTALQGQLLVILISIFGRTQNIAEVAALGRLGQLFLLLGAVNSTLIEPYFARLNRDLLLKRYLWVVGSAAASAVGIAMIAFLFPGPLLWILGHQYEHLDRELGWMMAGASLGYVGNVMWAIHAARKWIYWWGGWLYIASLTLLQAAFIACVDLDTTLSVLYLGLATNLVILAVHVVTALAGFAVRSRNRTDMSASLNIAFFVSADGKSGTYFRYHNLAVALVQRGHAVTVYSQSPEERRYCREEMRGNVHYVLAPSFPLNSYVPFALNPGNIVQRFITGWKKRETLARHQVFHLFQPFENSAWTWLWQQRQGRKESEALFVWDWDDLWCGGIHPWETMTRFQDRWHFRLMEKLERDLPRLADTVTTCSTFLAERASQAGARHVDVINNGFWPDAHVHSLSARADARRHFSLDPDAFYLGFTGFTAGEFEWCLDLLARFSGDRQVRFVCCGADVQTIISAQPETVRTRIDYLGFLSSPETRRLLGVIDVGLLPLEDSPFNESRLPIKFVEYLAAGLPALCSDIGEVGRLARKLDGVVLLPTTRKEWVDSCVEVIRELRTQRRTCRPNPRQLQDNLSWPVLAAQLETVYLRRRQVSQPGAPPAL